MCVDWEWRGWRSLIVVNCDSFFGLFERWNILYNFKDKIKNDEQSRKVNIVQTRLAVVEQIQFKVTDEMQENNISCLMAKSCCVSGEQEEEIWMGKISEISSRYIRDSRLKILIEFIIEKQKLKKTKTLIAHKTHPNFSSSQLHKNVSLFGASMHASLIRLPVKNVKRSQTRRHTTQLTNSP